MAAVKLPDFFAAPLSKSAAAPAAVAPAEGAVAAVVADAPIVLDATTEDAARASPAAPAPPASAPPPMQLAPPPTKADQAREAYAAIEKPVTEASFVRWYCATHNLKSGAGKRGAADLGGGAGASAPPAKKAATQPLFPGASAPPAGAGAGPSAAAAALPKGKKSAYVKGLMTSLKAAAKAKRWHKGDVETLTCSVVLDAADFAALMSGAGVSLPAATGVVTALSLAAAQLSALLGAGLDEAIKVPTWSRPRAFAKAFKSGDALLTFASAEGKYSRGTSTLTLKCAARAAGGSDDDCYGMW